jgi:hypothetical protein
MAYFKIDYYSFTIPTNHTFEGINDYVTDSIIQSFTSLSTRLQVFNWTHADFKVEKAKGFYTYRLRHESTGLALSVGHINAHILVEFSGKTCDNFSSIDELIPIVQKTSNRATRIDIACDFKCMVSPVDFAEQRNKKRWKFAPYYPSASGETVYIGSRSGERMGRVYRYNEPHPRAHLLRCECEYKGDAAKALAGRLNIVNEEVAFAEASAPFGFTHPIYTDRVKSADKLAYRKNSEKNKSTVVWLWGTVLSSLAKAVRDDVVDLDEYLIELRSLINEGHRHDWLTEEKVEASSQQGQ